MEIPTGESTRGRAPWGRPTPERLGNLGILRIRL